MGNGSLHNVLAVQAWGPESEIPTCIYKARPYGTSLEVQHRGCGDRRIPGTYWPASVVKVEDSGLVETMSPKLESDSKQLLTSTSGLYIDLLVHMHAHVNVYIHTNAVIDASPRLNQLKTLTRCPCFNEWYLSKCRKWTEFWREHCHPSLLFVASL